jgi:transcriptional regulator with XRE-family HTH domain
MGKEQATGLGERVRKRRKALGLTAKSLAKAAGVSTSYISQVERGHQEDPSLPALRRLADALSMDLHTLLGGQPPAPEVSTIPPPLADLVEEYKLSPEVAGMLASIQIDGRYPSTHEDWLFLLLAIRRACRVTDPLPGPATGTDKGEKHAMRS